MREYLPLKKRNLYIFLLFITILIIIFPSKIGKNVYAGVTRNIANREILSSYERNEGQCEGIDQSKGINLYQYSLDINPESMLAWRNLTFEKGIRDREWLENQIKLWSDQGKQEWIDQFISYLDVPSWGIQINWSNQRCLLEWKAFTLGLIYSTQGKWQEAVSYYQIGIALSSGELRPEIVAEYYDALANYTMLNNDLASDQLAAGKYFALAGNQEKAKPIFDELVNSKDLSEDQRCDAILGSQWVAEGDMNINSIPWPTYVGENEECLTEPGSKIFPKWLFDNNESYIDAENRILLGFDTDQDFLNAGAEIIGKFYWKTIDGKIDIEPFRQVNLWPNSGNNWLPFPKIWECLPGMKEPVWVSTCASQVDYYKDAIGFQNPIGKLIEPEAEGLDNDLNSVTKLVNKNQVLIIGGQWNIEGNFNLPHMLKYYINGTPPRFYDMILDLSNHNNKGWFTRVQVVEPLPYDYEYSFWLKPRTKLLGGTVWFDNVFIFNIPKN